MSEASSSSSTLYPKWSRPLMRLLFVITFPRRKPTFFMSGATATGLVTRADPPALLVDWRASSARLRPRTPFSRLFS